MNISVIGDRLVLEEMVDNEKEIGGLIIPQSSNDSPRECKVIGIGDAIVEVSVGQTVLIPKNSGIDVEYDGKKLLIVEINDIIAIVN